MKIQINVKNDFWDEFSSVISYYAPTGTILPAEIERRDNERDSNSDNIFLDSYNVISTTYEVKEIIDIMMNQWWDEADFRVLNFLEDILKRFKDPNQRKDIGNGIYCLQ